MRFFRKELFLLAAFWFACGPLLKAATFTWTGSVSSDWFNTNNWSPAGLPGSNDTVNFNSGTINLSAPVTINAQFNWAGGTLSGNPLMVTSNGALNISGSAGKALENALTNAGTVTWTGSGGITVVNNTSSDQGAIWNLPGALFNIATDQSINCYYCDSYEFFNNQGTLEKTAGTGTTYISIVVTNTGTVEALAGALNFNSGGSIGGAYAASAGAAINFTGGTFTANAAAISGAGTVAQTGGTLTLLSNTIANLQLNGGTLVLASNFQGGVITNLTLAGGVLSGANTVTGALTCGGGFTGPLLVEPGATMNWTGGTASGSLTVASNGALNISGSGGKALQNALTNAGTVTWTGSGGITVENNFGSDLGAVWNLPGAVFDIATDQSINCYYCDSYEFFNNQGTLEKTAGTGTTYISIVVTNTGTVEALEGTLNFNSGGSIAGAYAASAGAAINFTGGTFAANAAAISGAGTVAQTGGTLTLLSNTIANLQLNGGTLVLASNFQGGVITNLTLAGSVLSGANTVTGTLTCGGGFTGPLLVEPGATMNWTGGTASGWLTVASNGALNISGSGRYLENALTNAGTVTMTGSGSITVVNNTSSDQGAIWNLPGAVFDIATDQSINCYYCDSYEFFNNQGTLEKTAGTGTTYISIVVTNTGTVEAVEGTLDFNNGGSIGGAYAVSNGAAINFNSGNFIANAPAISGPGPAALTGGTLTLLSDVIANLQLNGGTLILASNFQGGVITNLTLAGSVLSGANTVTGTLTCGGGFTGPLLVEPGATMNWTGGTASGWLTVASNGALNISGSGRYLENALTNAGTVTMTGSGSITVVNNTSSDQGAIWNLPGAVFDIATDQSINCYYCDSYEFFNNQGTLEKTAGTGTTYISIVVTNTGTVEALEGTLNFNNGGSIGGAYAVSNGAAINFNSGNFIANAPAIGGPGPAALSGGTLTLLSDVIPNLELNGGTVILAPTFQGGVITDLTLAGSVLSGTNTVTGTLTCGGGFTGPLLVQAGATMNWTGGTGSGSLTVASNGALNISGSYRYLENALTNEGTVTLTGSGGITVVNNNSSYQGAIWNLPGAVFDIATDQNINCYYCDSYEFLNNQGTLEKTAGTGTTTINVVVTNTGTVEAVEGTLNFNNGGLIGGTYNVAATATNNFTGGNFSAGVATVSGPGPAALAGGTLTLLSNVIPNLELTGGTVDLGAGFEGGVITNLVISGSALNGANIVAGTLTWTAGEINGPLTVVSNAALNISGSSTKYLENVLTNAGTVTWTGTGSLSMVNNHGAYLGAIWNLPEGVFNIATDENINCDYCTGYEFFNNQGTLEKTAGTGTTYISVLVTNTGTVEALEGTLNFNGGGGIGGDYTADSGAAINFASGTFSAGVATINGPGPVTLTGGTVALLSNVIANLELAGGTVTVGTNFEGGTITNLTIAGSTLSGNAIVGGTLVWTAGTIAGPLIVASNGLLVLSGSSTKYLENALTNAGTVTWTGTGSLSVVNNHGAYVGAIWNLPGALFEIETDENINCYYCTGYEFFNNQGIVEKSASSNTTTISILFTNSGTLNVQSGLVSFAANPAYVQTGETLDFGVGGTNNHGAAAISGNVNFDGTLGVNFLNGYTPNTGDTITLINYGSHGGTFSSLNLPPLPGGQAWELDYTGAGLVLRVVAAGTNDTLLIKGSVTGTNGHPIAGASVYAFMATNTFTNPIVNGSFELPTNNGVNYTVYNPGSTNIPGWTVIGPGPVDISGPFLGAAEDGTQYFDPTGSLSGTGGGITQTFPTTIGASYKLAFYMGYSANPGQVSLGVTVNGISNAFSVVNNGTGGLNWTPEAMYFTASSNLTTVTFETLTTYDSDNSFVDNVQVTPPDYGRVLEGVTDTNGQYQIAVANGTFQVGVNGLPGLGYNNVAEQTAVVVNSNQTVNFTAQALTGAQLFTITTAVNPPGAGTASGGGTLAAGATATVTATPITNTLPYLFANWTENGVFQSASNIYSFTVIRNRELVANFTLPLFTIAASNNPSNAGVITGTGSYFYGATNVLTAYPNFGYNFTNWTEGTNIVGTNTTLATVVFTNHSFVANYVDANLIHLVSTVTSPAGLAAVAGAGSYTNGQTADFSAPLEVTNSPFFYTFEQFTLSNTVVSTNASFDKTFSTLDATNLQYVAVYKAMTILPLLTNVTANYINPVRATTNFLLALQFDRSMNTNVVPVVVLTNSAATLQPAVGTNGYWTTTSASNDTYHTPPVTFSPGMDGTMQLIVSGAQDLYGNVLTLTNAATYLVEATPPPAPVLSVVASNSSSVTVAWTSYAPPPDLAGFRVYIENTNYTSLTGVPVYTALGSGARTYQYGGLLLNTNYYLAVQAVDTAGNALTAVTPLAVNLPSSLPPPVSIQVAAAGASNALVSWNGYNTSALLGFAGYMVYYQQTNFSSVAALTPQATVAPGQTSLQVNGLDRTKTTYFAVVGYNNTNGFNPNVTTATWSDPYAGNIGVTTTIGGAGQTVVNIYQSIVVVSNAALIVEPGTTLLFAPGTSLTVDEGALVANGTALAPIIFDSANDTPGRTPAPGDWGGVMLEGGAGTSSLQFVEILYGGGLTLSTCSPTVQAFTASGNSPWGLGLSNGASLTTSAALLTGNGIGAGQLDSASLTIQNSVIQNNNTNAWAAGSLAMNATSNWWGTGAAAGVAASLAGDVSYNPFLGYEPLLTPAIGTSNGLTQVGGSSVLLQLACRTAVSMRLSEDFTFGGVFFSPFTNYALFPLSAGGGLKHIFAQFRSVTGATNSPIELDVNYITAGPVIQSFSLADGQTLHRPLTVTGSATATLGMQDIEFYLDGIGLATNAGGSFSYYFDIRTLNNATHQAQLLARDNAGNIATLESDIIIAVTPPVAPVITVPAGDYLTNNATVTVSGTAEPAMNIEVTANGQVLGVTNADTNGKFTVANATLAEGVNTLVAVASDNTGTTPSAARHITVETIPPVALVMNPPVYTPGSGLSLTWQFAPSGKQASTFQLFWSTSSFTATNQAAFHSIALSVMSDTLQGLANGTYYFGVVGFDAAGNASPLSALVSAVYNATPPALSITYGEPSPVGVGPLAMTLSSSKALAATPALTIQPAGASSPVLLNLTNVALNIWQTAFVVSPSTPSGTAAVQAAAQDQFGNVFNGPPAGPELMIDTTPPTGTIVTAPTGPVQTVNPTNVTINLVLSKLAQAGTTPTLSFTAPIYTNVPIVLSGAGSNWNGTLTLTPAMGSGFGTFSLSAVDAVGNVGSNIVSGGQLELYNTPLPSPPADPTGLSAVSLPGGYIRLSWNPVSDAQIYRLYREAGTNFSTNNATLDLDNITNTTVTDLPTNDGFYAYAVSASRFGSESGFASALIALSDRTPPPAPTNVVVALAASGVQISWQQPAGETPDHYNIYRNGALVSTTYGAGPVVDYPPRGTNTYVVDSSDAIGNQNPSAPATIILLVGPPASLAVVVSQGQAPLLSWSSTDPSATGFNIYRNGTLQNASPLTGTNYTDNLPLSDAVTYAVTAVNNSAQESPPRLVNVYPIGLGLLVNPTNHPIFVNYFDQYQAGITNLSTAAGFPLAQWILTRNINGVSPLSVTQSVLTVVGAGANAQPSLIVPEAPVAAAQTVQLSAFQQTDSEGSSVVYENSFTFTNAKLPGVEIVLTANQLPLAGGLTPFQAQINNPSSTPIEVIVSRGDGLEPGDLYISVQNGFGQEVSRTSFPGIPTPPGTTFLADGRAYVQINAGSSLNITVPGVLVPFALAGSTNTTFVAVVSNIYSQIGTAGETVSGPLTGGMISSSLAVPPYDGTAQTDQSVYENNQPIIISGQALSTSTGLPVPNAALNIGFATRGYHWFQPVTTDTNGNYQYIYNPVPGFAGTLSIWAANPLVVDQLNEAAVIVYRAYASPSTGEVEMSKNGTISFAVQLLNPGDVPLTGFGVSCAAYQVSGTNQTPISTLTGTSLSAPGFTIPPNQSQTVTLQLASAINAPSSAEAVFTFTSAEGAVATLTASVTLLPAVPVINIVSPAVGYVEVNVNRGEQVSSQVTIVNSGLTTLQGITILPPTNETWMQLNIPVSSNGLLQLPDLPQGQSNTFTVVFTPPTNTPLAQYQDDLLIQGTNLATPFLINLYAIVTSDLTGSVQFEVEDFLADYLSGASVRLQNNLIQASAGPFLTDTNGLVTVTNLEEGVWDWQVTAPGCSAASGTVTIEADQTVYQNPILSRSLVTINFSVVPVPFTDQYEITVSQTFSTFVPVPVLVLSPPYTTFNNVTPGFQANFNVSAQNAGLIQITDINITGQQDNQAALTPLITYMPVLLPQQTVEIPFTAMYSGTNSPGPQGLGGTLAGCLPGSGLGGLFSAFLDGLAALAQGNGLCQVSGLTLLIGGAAACGFVAAQAAAGAVAIVTAPLVAAASFAGCLIGNLLADTGGGGGGGGGGAALDDGQTVLPEGDGCLAPSTAVLMADGSSKPISQIQTNDVVRTGPRANNMATVSAVYSLDSGRLEEIDLAGPASKVLATPEHFFWVDGKGWTAVSRLQPGDWLFNSADRRVQITGIKIIDSNTKVYTLKLSGDDAFYANDVLARDLCGAPAALNAVPASKVEVAK
jgi:choice-of-anchor C domain-containing protein